MTGRLHNGAKPSLGEPFLIILGQDIWLGGTVTGAGTDTGTGTGTGTGERVTPLRHC